MKDRGIKHSAGHGFHQLFEGKERERDTELHGDQRFIGSESVAQRDAAFSRGRKRSCSINKLRKLL